MKSIISLLIAFLAIPCSLNAQKKCDCENVLGDVIEKVEVNYPGFQDKIDTISTYKMVKQKLAKKAADSNIESCVSIVNEYLDQFNDDHIIFGLTQLISNGSPESIRAKYQNSQKLDLDQSKFLKYLNENQLEPLEGVWTDGTYRVGIIAVDSSEYDYLGFVIKADSLYWMPGQIKIKLKRNGEVSYLMKDHTERILRYEVEHELMTIFGLSGNWIKVPGNEKNEADGTYGLTEWNKPYLEKINNKTSYLRISSFEEAHEESIGDLIQEYITDRPAENLVIDVRGNGGGADKCFYPLLSLIYTDTIRNVGWEFYATDFMRSKAKKWLKATDEEPWKSRLESFNKELASGQSRFASLDGAPPEFFAYDSVLVNPRKVAIIVDKHCASSTEEFLLAAKQSDKVTIYGESTKGVLDYSSIEYFELGCDKFFALYLPTTRSNRLPDNPIDPHGISPDIAIGSDVSNWKGYVLSQM